MRTRQSSRKNVREQNSEPRMRIPMRFGDCPQNAKNAFGIARCVPLVVGWGFPSQDYRSTRHECYKFPFLFDFCDFRALFVTDFDLCLIFLKLFKSANICGFVTWAFMRLVARFFEQLQKNQTQNQICNISKPILENFKQKWIFVTAKYEHLNPDERKDSRCVPLRNKELFPLFSSRRFVRFQPPMRSHFTRAYAPDSNWRQMPRRRDRRLLRTGSRAARWRCSAKARASTRRR